MRFPHTISVQTTLAQGGVGVKYCALVTVNSKEDNSSDYCPEYSTSKNSASGQYEVRYGPVHEAQYCRTVDQKMCAAE